MILLFSFYSPFIACLHGVHLHGSMEAKSSSYILQLDSMTGLMISNVGLSSKQDGLTGLMALPGS